MLGKLPVTDLPGVEPISGRNGAHTEWEKNIEIYIYIYRNSKKLRGIEK